MDNELPFNLNKNQKAMLDKLHEAAGNRFSWKLARVQGTGVKYWVIDLNNGYEWSGDVDSTIEGKTVKEVIDNAVTRIRKMSTFTFKPISDLHPYIEATPLTLVVDFESEQCWSGRKFRDPFMGYFILPKATWQIVPADIF